MKGKYLKENHYVLLFAALWFAFNLFFLESYPFVHTDEPWLSGLTRSIMESGSLSATEDFFDLYPRHPHAIKILYHLFQIPLIGLFGYGIFSVRLLSLLAGAVSLLLFYRLIRNIYPESPEALRFLILCILSVDIQFLYGTHMARQESLLLMMEIASLLILTEKDMPVLRRGILSGLIIGTAAAVHPNAFIIAWPAGLYLLLSIAESRLPGASGENSRTMKEGLIFLAGAVVPALVVVLISFCFNPHFISDYRAYGEPLGVLAPPDVKWLRLPGFYEKLFLRIGGTYHTPPIYLQMVLFPLVLCIDFYRNRHWINAAGFIGFNMAIAIIGKYSQPSIVFLLPFYYLAAAGSMELIYDLYTNRILLSPPSSPALLPEGEGSFELLAGSSPSGLFGNRLMRSWMKTIKKLMPIIIPAVLLLSATAYFSISDITSEKESFSSFIKEIEKSVPSDGILLGNLYGEYVTGLEGRFNDWRNLAYLKDAGLTLREYLNERSIEYVMLGDELDFIYRNRPVWNVLYGNIAHWYPQLLGLIEERGILVDEFKSPGYGVRIAPYRYQKDWKVRIYKVDQSGSISE
ncbi:MAG: glycosyltransferase family 39 protein [Spirochaetales bacterium]|nr:glycosyltransferase family 39 protein [Spirochaetales bacterium]